MGKREQFVRYCRDVLERPDFLETQGGQKYPVNNAPERQAILEMCQEVIRTNTREYWLEKCAQGDGVPAAPCSSVAEIGDPNNPVGRFLRANNFVRQEQHR